MIPLTLICLALVALLAYQQREHSKERERLYTARTTQRAPAFVGAPGDVEPPAWVAPDDDDAFADALRDR